MIDAWPFSLDRQFVVTVFSMTGGIMKIESAVRSLLAVGLAVGVINFAHIPDADSAPLLTFVPGGGVSSDPTDSDADGVPDDIDNAPFDANGDQSDVDMDGVGDVADNAPGTFNPLQADADGDFLGDVIDSDPMGFGLDSDGDLFPDPVDPDPTDGTVLPGSYVLAISTADPVLSPGETLALSFTIIPPTFGAPGILSVPISIDLDTDGTPEGAFFAPVDLSSPFTFFAGEVGPEFFAGFAPGAYTLGAVIGPGFGGLGLPAYATGGHIDELTYFVEGAVIPVPAALPLLLTGLAGLGLIGWRRRKAA